MFRVYTLHKWGQGRKSQPVLSFDLQIIPDYILLMGYLIAFGLLTSLAAFRILKNRNLQKSGPNCVKCKGCPLESACDVRIRPEQSSDNTDIPRINEK